MGRILVVDDNLLVRTLLRQILEYGGHIVAGEAHDGLEVASLVRQLKPDVVILDLIMPGRDGLSALQDLTTCAPTVPVLICSAALTAHRVIKGLQLGAKGFISKPFDREAVLGALDKLAEDRLPSPPATHPFLERAAAARAHERRNFPRVAVSLAVTLTTATARVVQTTTVDAGGGGLLLATKPLRDGQVVDFRVDLGARWQPITGRARAVRTTTDEQQGLAFEHISIADHEQLVRFLACVEKLQRQANPAGCAGRGTAGMSELPHSRFGIPRRGARIEVGRPGLAG